MATCTGIDTFFPSAEHTSPFDDVHDSFELVTIPLEGSNSELLPGSFWSLPIETVSSQSGKISQEPQDPIKSLNIYEALQEASTLWTQPALQLDTTHSHNFRRDAMEVKKEKTSIHRYYDWSAKEDAKLLKLVNSMGENWYVISRHFKNKDRYNCRYRYFNQTKRR
jgi:hypothetical protein